LVWERQVLVATRFAVAVAVDREVVQVDVEQDQPLVMAVFMEAVLAGL
jgi:hypothetical protein